MAPRSTTVLADAVRIMGPAFLVAVSNRLAAK